MRVLVSASAADWTAALGQVAGAVGTAVAVVVALWIARRDGRRSERDRADRDAAQARLVVTEVRREGEWLVRTTNLSAAPVFEVALAGGWSAVERAGSPAVIDMLEPGRAVDRPAVASDPSAATEAVITFLDAAGLRWRRVGRRPPERSPVIEA